MKILNGMDVCVHNQNATILKEYMPGMYEVRIWDGSRHVGDIVVPTDEIKPANTFNQSEINEAVSNYKVWGD